MAFKEKVYSRYPLHLSCKGAYSRPIPYIGEDVALKICQELDKSLSYSTYDPSWANKTFRQHFLILREKVKLWSLYLKENNLVPFDTPLNVIKKNILNGQDYADYLKDYTNYSIRHSLGIEYSSGEEHFIFDDINQIYPHQHLINFIRKKDFSDILDYAFTKPKIRSDINKLRLIFRKNLKENVNFRKVDSLDYLSVMDEKGSFEKGRTTFSEALDYDPKGHIPSNLIYRINSIHKTPSESRVIAIAEPHCKLFLKYTRSMYKQLFDCKYDFYGKNRYSFEKRLHQRKDIIHLLFDQKKCGWTFPFELLEVLFEEISNLYPEVEEFNKLKEYFKYGDIYYQIEGLKKQPVRGFTLGMFDDAVSFIIACMFENFKESLNLPQGFYEQNISGLFFGDDCDIIFENMEPFECQSIGNKWIYYMDSYGIYVNLKKSFYSRSGIFCEVYGRNDTKQTLKHVYYCIQGLDILLAHNTAHAKNLFSSFWRTLITYTEYIPSTYIPGVMVLLNEVKSIIISSFPYEFVRNEYQFPYEVGGWIQFLEEGKNLVLEMYLNHDFCKSFSKLYGLKLPLIYKYVKNNDKKYFTECLTKSEFWVNMRCSLFLDNDEDVFFTKYCNSVKNSSAQAKIWWEFQDIRIKTFNKPSPDLFLQNFWHVPFTKMKLDERCFSKIDSKSRFDYFTIQKPKEFVLKEPKTHMNKIRALDLTRNPVEQKGPCYNVEFYNKIRIQDIYSQLDIDLAKNKYIIPTIWWRVCRLWNIPIEVLYKELLEQGYSLFEYEPKFYKNDKTFEIEKIFELDKEFIFWAQECCSFVTVDRDEAYLLQNDIFAYNYKQLLAKKLNLGNEFLYDQFVQGIKDLYLEENIDDFDIEEEIKNMNMEGVVQYSRKVIGTIYGSNTILEYERPNVELVAEYDPEIHGDMLDSDFESDEEEKIELYPGYFVTKREWENMGDDDPNVLYHGSSLLDNIPSDDDEEPDLNDWEPP